MIKQALLNKFNTAYKSGLHARVDIGNIWAQMLLDKGKVSKKTLADKLQELYPNAKSDLGYVLSSANLDNLATIATAFGEGSIRRGNQSITLDDVQELGITAPKEIAELVEKLENGDVRVKSITKAVDNLRKGDMTKAQATIDNIFRPVPVPVSDQITAKQKQIDSLREKLAVLETEMLALTATQGNEAHAQELQAA